MTNKLILKQHVDQQLINKLIFRQQIDQQLNNKLIWDNKLTNSWVTCCFEVEIQHVEQELINMLNFLSESWSTVDQLSLFEGVDGVWEMLINCWSTSMRRTNTTCCTTVDQYVDYLTKSWSTVDENVDFCDQINSWSTVEQLLLTQHCWTTVDQHVEYPSNVVQQLINNVTFEK